MASPLGLCQLLLEPLQSVLSGRCFTASLTLSRRTHSQKGSSGARYIASRFHLLGDLGNLSVVSLLKWFSGCPMVNVTNIAPHRSSIHKKPEYEEQNVSKDAISLIHSPLSAIQLPPSQQGVLELHSLSCVSSTSKTPISKSLSPMVHGGASQSVSLPATASPTMAATHFLPLSNQSKSKPSCSDCVSGTSGLPVDPVMLCDELVDELISVWESFSSQPTSSCDGIPSTFDSGTVLPGSTNASNTYNETLPDSESFLAEFQCDFELSLRHSESTSPSSSPLRECSNTLSTPTPHCPIASSDCLQLTPANLCVPDHSPELFTGSHKKLCASSAADENLSPELFSSPSAGSPAPVLGVSSVKPSVNVCTPAIGRGVRVNPRRNILSNPTKQSCGTPALSGLVTHSASSGDDPLISRNNSCFSPELFL